MQDFLSRMNISGFNVDNYFSKHSSNADDLPNIALAFSGGGYRAMLNGAGALAAFDNRTAQSTSSGHIGGLLQASTYIAGLSGGSWLVGSVYINNFSSVEQLASTGPGNSGSFWQIQNSILDGTFDLSTCKVPC